MTDVTPEQLRSVTLDELRAWYVEQCEVASVRSIALASEVDKNTLRQFVSGITKPHPRVRTRLALYYLQVGGREAATPLAALTAAEPVRALPPPRAALAIDRKKEPPYPGADLQAIREHAAMRVRESSLRTLAERIPLKRATLYTFLRKPERKPQDRTRAALVEWYYREMDSGRDAETALGILSRFVVGPEAQRELRNNLLDALERAIREAGREVPAWVSEMRK